MYITHSASTGSDTHVERVEFGGEFADEFADVTLPDEGKPASRSGSGKTARVARRR